jgi:tRNA threonylcarbamoyladenosine biosynthesis protein TsaB
MRIVALDTATRATATALADVLPGEPPQFAVERYHEPAADGRPGHGRELLVALQEVLEAAGGGWSCVDRVAVGIGPGTFTGLRIGVASAQALARSGGIPLVGVSSLHALGLGAADWRSTGVLALIDARRGEVFAAGWSAGSDLLQAPLHPGPMVLAPERLRDHAARGSVAVGDGAIRYRAVLEDFGVAVPGDDDPAHRISALSHCRLSAMLAAAPRPRDIQPAYLRIPDAEIADTRRAPNSGDHVVAKVTPGGRG